MGFGRSWPLGREWWRDQRILRGMTAMRIDVNQHGEDGVFHANPQPL